MRIAAIMRPGGARHGDVSLLMGWVPITVQLVAAVAVVASLVSLLHRTGRRRSLRLAPVTVLAGVVAVAGAWWLLRDQGLAADPVVRCRVVTGSAGGVDNPVWPRFPTCPVTRA